MSMTISGTQIAFPDASTQNTAATGFGFKNRIINGAMLIAQRGTSAVVSNAGGYPVDRFFTNCDQNRYTVQQSSTAPSGFTGSLLCTVTSAGSTVYAQLYQAIEGYNVADLGWGAAGAATVTFSFWVKSSVTGTFSGGVVNGAADRSYVFTFTVSTTNWEQKTITIPGDTSGTWPKDNSSNMSLKFDLGSGASYTTSSTNTWIAGHYFKATGSASFAANAGATLYITGVQLEVGSTATSFDYRPYGTELSLCQRYWEKSYDYGTALGASSNYVNSLMVGSGANSANSTTNGYEGWVYPFKVPKRATPTITGYDPASGASGSWQRFYTGVSPAGAATVAFFDIGTNGFKAHIAAGSAANCVAGHFTASAEL